MSENTDPDGPEAFGIRPRARQARSSEGRLFAPPDRAAALGRRLGPVGPASSPDASEESSQDLPGRTGRNEAPDAGSAAAHVAAARPTSAPVAAAAAATWSARRGQDFDPSSQDAAPTSSSHPGSDDAYQQATTPAARSAKKVPVMLYVSPGLQAALKQRVGRQRTLESQVIDSVERTVSNGRLREALGGGLSTSSLGFTRERDRQPVEARTPVSFRTHVSNVQVLDRLMHEYGARDRNHLITTALQLDLVSGD